VQLTVPEFALVLLVGPSGAGKSGFAARHFLPTEVVSSDGCRALVSDDATDQSATGDAFEVLNLIVRKRLERRRLTVVDATNVQRSARAPLLALAKEFHALSAAVVFDLPEGVCIARNRERPDRDVGTHVVRRQFRDLKRSNLKREGVRYVYTLRTPEEVEAATPVRQPLWTNRKEERGPFDLIGDVHGCADELEALLATLGYVWTETGTGRYRRLYRHPEGRKAVFVGDLVDRGPRVLDTYELVRNMVAAGSALCVLGNHEAKLERYLRGQKVRVTHGLERTLAELEALPEGEREGFKREMADFLGARVSHYVLDEGKLVVAHAGLTEELQGRASGAVRAFALYGDTTGETDEGGLPVRRDWAAEYRGAARVVYGHTPVPVPKWHNRTLNLDTGCVFGGALTALRYPEGDLVSVPAARTYAAPARAFQPEAPSGDLLEVADLLGKDALHTRLRGRVPLREDQRAAALETLSRSALDPRWLIYLPPTMAAPETSAKEDLLEHPAETFAYYRRAGAREVVCEEKHMGSRAVLVVCHDEETAERRFGGAGLGACYTRTGRAFFEDGQLETALLTHLRDTLTESGFWEDFETDWACLDAELMPWSVKAQGLLETQYAAVGAAGRGSSEAALAALTQAAARGVEVGALQARTKARADTLTRYTEAYRRYCWPVAGLKDLELAPFHLLATEGGVHTDKTHLWHLETLARYLPGDLYGRTAYRVVHLDDPASETAAVAWWEDLTARGGEGMVVKPHGFITYGTRGLVQPAVKVRGREYLRLIYGPEYTLPENLARLKARHLGTKRTLATQEFALGLEALERFVQGEPLWRVHECVFGVLALESEPVDPRL